MIRPIKALLCRGCAPARKIKALTIPLASEFNIWRITFKIENTLILPSDTETEVVGYCCGQTFPSFKTRENGLRNPKLGCLTNLN